MTTSIMKTMESAMATTSTMKLWLLALAWTLAAWDGALAVNSSCYSSWKLESFRNARLTVSVFLNVSSRSPIDCADSCFFLHEGKCKSFNFHKALDKCELSAMTTHTKNVTTTIATGWRYYRRKINTNEDLSVYGARHCHYNPCPPGSLDYAGKCYLPHSANSTTSGPCCTQQAAHANCRAKFGILARINSTELRELLHGVLTAHPEQKFYIDLKRSGSGWAWDDGTMFQVPVGLWNPGQPDDFGNTDGPENCVGIEQSQNFLMNDVPCSLSWAYVCQYEPRIYTLW